jgi:hypothetical protein
MSGDEEIGGRPVARDRDVIDHRDPQQRLHVHVVRVRLERIQEDHEIEPAFHDSRANLPDPRQAVRSETA